MKQFKRLAGYELWKIGKRKSVWITLGIMAALLLFIACSGLFREYSIIEVEDGHIGNDGQVVDDALKTEYVETGAKYIKINRENGRKISGRVMDERLWEEVKHYYKKLEAGGVKYLLTEEYQKDGRRYRAIYDMMLTYGVTSRTSPLTMTMAELYQARKDYQAVFYREYRMKEEEQAYWDAKTAEITEPMVYEYADAWYVLLSQDFYLVGIFIIFLTAICVSGVFTEEHSRKMDQLVLCTKYGRKELYCAKIFAGSLFSVCSGCLLLAVALISEVAIFGGDGFGAQICLYIAQYGFPITIGGMFLMAALLLFFVSLLSGVLTMVLAEIIKNGVGTLAILIGVTILMRMLPVPIAWRGLSQFFSYFPVNLLHQESLFDMRLVSLFGLKFMIFQFAPIVYTVVIVLLILLGKRVYCRYQVDSR